jgi:hypothetical protein
MTTAAQVATDVIQSEADAVVASTAASVAMLAADSAIIAAETQVAQVVTSAAQQINAAENAIAENEEDVSWLKQKTQALEAQNLSMLEKISTLETSISELLALVASLSLTQPTQEPIVEEVIPAMPLTPPESAVGQQEALAQNLEVNPLAQEKKLLKRL